MTARHLIISALLAVFTAALYLPRLERAPVFLTNDEVSVALNARSIAATGRDLDGRFMPLWFHSPNLFSSTGLRIWPATVRVEQYVFLPIVIYAVAIVLKIMPFTETAIRLPLVIAAVGDVLLVYFIGLALFQRRRVAILAAGLLALTPAHFAHARLALPAQISGPFVLGWLLCVVLYFRRHDPRLLFASGVLLGVAAIGYIGPLVAVYGLLTCIALYQRREPWQHYGFLIVGGLLPGLYFLWMVLDPGTMHDILVHYQQSDTGPGIFARATQVAYLYWGFWNPRFLFTEGAVRYARSAGAIGVFLLPVAGLLVVGILSLAQRLSPTATLLLGGFFSAPLPASFVGEERAIWRALEVAPFGVLLAAYGLQRFLRVETARDRWTVFAAIFGVSIALAVTYHDNLPHAQPMIRLLIVPVAVAALATLLGGLAGDSVLLDSRAVVPVVALASVQVVYTVGYANLVNIAVPILAMITLAAVQSSGGGRSLSPLVVVTSLSLLASEFIYFHVDYPLVHRVGAIPASAIVLAMRLASTAIVLPAAIAVGLLLRRVADRRGPTTGLVVAASVAIIALQLAYYHVDYYTEYRARFLYVSALLLFAVGVAAVLSRVVFDGPRFAGIAAVALFAAACVQFGYFYADYFRGYQTQTVTGAAGNVRVAWEYVIEQAHHRPVPAIFMGEIGPYQDAGLYWRFYLIKHDREDLLARTIEGEPFQRNRIRALPVGSLLITSPSVEIDKIIEQMEVAGELRRDDRNSLIRAQDGTPLFWVLERSAS